MFEELKEFGLSDNELNIYVSLLKTGMTTANRLAKITGIKRSTTYDNLNILENKGIVSVITKEKVNFYVASDPNKIIRLLDEKKDKINKILPELNSLKRSMGGKTGATLFEGKKGVITVLNDILDERKELLFYGSRKMALIPMQYYPDNFIQKRINLRINLKAVLAEEDRGDKVYKSKKTHSLSKLKFSKYLNGIKANTYVYGDKVSFITSTENLIGIIIKNKGLVEQQRKIFDILWKKADR